MNGFGANFHHGLGIRALNNESSINGAKSLLSVDGYLSGLLLMLGIKCLDAALI